MHCSCTTELDRCCQFHNIARDPRISWTGQDSANRSQMCRTDSNRLSAHLPYNLLGLLTIPYINNSGSIHAVSFLVNVQALGLSIPLAVERIYTGIFRPLIRNLHYYGSCITLMAIPLTLTVIERTIKEATLCCCLV